MAIRELTEHTVPELRQAATKVFRKGGGTRPDVMLIDLDSELYILKDHGGCDPWFARVVGPILARRESKALEKLSGVRGVPELINRPDSRSILMEYLSATTLSDYDGHKPWPEFFESMDRLLAKIHSRGVAHCDLRSPFNTMITADGEPVIVDFVASISRGKSWNPLSKWLFDRFTIADRQATTKLKTAVAPDLVSAREREQFLRQSKLEKSARFLGAGIRNLSRKLFTR